MPTLRERVRLISTLSNERRLGGGDLLVAGALLGLLSRAILYKTERSGDPITFPSDLTGFNDQAELNLFQLGRESRVVADLFSSMSARQSLPSADAILAAIGATVNVSSDANSGIVSLGGKAPLSGFPIVSSASSVSRLENVAISLTTETSQLHLTAFGRELLEQFIQDIDDFSGFDINVPPDEDFVDLLTDESIASAYSATEAKDDDQQLLLADLLGDESSDFLQTHSVADLAIAPDDDSLPYYPVGSVGGALGGGGGSSGINASGGLAGSFSGAVIDGYVENTLVFIDRDNDSVWDTNEEWSITDADGVYSFTYSGDISGFNIVTDGDYYYNAGSNTVYTDEQAATLGLNSDYLITAVDVTTLASVTSVMKSSAAVSGYVTPLSTVYALAGGGTSGEALLSQLGLSAADLTYDPSKTTSDNAATVLKAGASLLTVVSNAATLMSEVGGVSLEAASTSVFSKIAEGGVSLSSLLSTKVSTAIDATATGSVTLSGGVVTGSETLFLEELDVGDYIRIDNSDYKVTGIASDTSLTVSNTTASVTAASSFKVSTADAAITELLTTTFAASNLSISANVISATASAAAGVTSALQALDTEAVQAGSVYSLAAAGQTTVLADIKSIAQTLASGGTVNPETLDILSSTYAASNIATVAASAATKLAFNAADPKNPISTKSETVILNAPTATSGDGAVVSQTYNVLANDSITGGGQLQLGAVGLFDPNAKNGKILGLDLASGRDPVDSDGRLLINGLDAAKHLGMRIEVLTAKGTISATVTGIEAIESPQTEGDGWVTLGGEIINSQTGAMTTQPGLPADYVAAIEDTGATYLVSKPLPANITLGIEKNQVKVTNTYSANNEFGELQIIYVAQSAADPTIAKTGLMSLNVRPPKPTVSFKTNTTKTFTEAEGVAGATNQMAGTLSDNSAKTYTVVDAPITVSGLGISGTVQIRGLPDDAYLRIRKSDNSVTTEIAKDVGSPNWTFTGADALALSAPGAQIEFLLPSDLAGTYALTVVATSRYGGLSSRTTDTATITVTPNADGLTLVTDSDNDPFVTLTDQAVPDSATEDTAFGLDSSGAILLIKAALGRRVDTDGSEFLGLRIELPSGWTALFTSTVGIKQTIQTVDDQTTITVYATDSTADSISTALKALRITPAKDFSGDATISLKLGTFETALASDGIPAASDFQLLSNQFQSSISVQPVSDTPSIALLTTFDSNWNQEAFWQDYRYEIPVTFRVASPDTVPPNETLYLAVGKAELDVIGASLDVTSPEIREINGKDYLQFAVTADGLNDSGNYSFSVIVPSTVSESLILNVVSVASDQGAEFAYSPVVAVSIPLVETPRIPTYSITNTSTYLEDAGLSLGDLLEISPGVGREYSTLKVFIKLPNDDFKLSLRGQEIPRSEDVTVDGVNYSVADLSQADLADFRIVAPANFKGDIAGVQVFVRDTARTGVAADSSVSDALTLSVNAVADGINAELLATSPDLNLDLGIETKLYDPVDPTSGLFSKIALLDSSESYVAKLVFKSTFSDALAIKVGGRFVLPQTVNGDLVYSFTQAQLTSDTDAISITAKSALYGKTIELQVLTADGTAVSGVATETIGLTLSASPVAPDASLSNASGAEDTAISVPVSVAINPDRVAFEKIGFEVTSADAALQGGTFSIGNQSFTFSGGKWTIFDADSQIDFATLKFTPPANYSGRAVFDFASFSQTASGVQKATPVTVTVDVTPVAEVVQAADTAPAALAASEDGAVAFPIASYFKTTDFTDADEKVSLEISLSSSIALQKATGSSYANLVPISTNNGVSTYAITADQTSFTSGLDGYRLLPAKDFASASAAGNSISIKATAYETSNGAQSAAVTQIVSLVVTPVADIPNAPLSVRPVVSVDESQATSSKAWYQASDAVKLTSLVPADASGETLTVQVTASNNLVVAVKNGSDYAVKTSVAGSDSGTLVYSLTPAEYNSLWVRGADYQSGSASLSVKTVATESWGGSTASSAPVTAAFTLKPVASGPDSGPVLKQVTVNEDPGSGAPTLEDFIQTPAQALDASESLFYKVIIPANAKLVAVSGALPTASPEGAGSLSYLVSATDAALQNFKIVPAAQYSGDLTVKFQAVTQETDGSRAFGTEQTSTLVVAPVSDAPILVAPTAVSGLIASDGDTLAIPIQTALTDASETLSVRVWVKGLSLADSANVRFQIDGSDVQLDSVVLNDESVFYFDASDAATISKLSTLTVSSTADFRGSDKLQLQIESTSKDGSAVAATSTKTVDLSIYQPIGAPTLNLDPFNVGPATVVTKSAIPFTLALPADLPSGIGQDSISVLVTGAPNLGYFAVKSGSGANATFTPVGASLGDGGVWLFKASDLLNSNGSSKTLVLIDSGATESGALSQMTAQAFISDSVGGSSNQSATESYSVTFKLGEDVADNTDPLILSLSGDAITSSASNGTISFELDSFLSGAEEPTYWVSGDAATKEGYAFLVRAGVTEGQTVGLADLYADFGELAGTDGVLASDGQITGAELPGVSLWFDSATSGNRGVIDQGELLTLTEALPDFVVTVPEQVARAASAGDVVPLYEATATWTGGPAAGGSLFAVAIPYQSATPLTSETVSNQSPFTNAPTAKVSVIGQLSSANSAEVPEDQVGGIKFAVEVGKATLAGASVTHLVKVYGVPDSASLSVGAKVVPKSGPTFWVLTEDQIASPISIIGLPTNYVADISLKAQVVASAVVSGQVSTVAGRESTVAVADIIGVADKPLLTPNVTQIDGTEAGQVYLTANGLVGGSSVADIAKGSADPNETLYARVTLDTDDGNVQAVSVGGLSITPVAGSYEVLAADLGKLSINFSDYFNGDINLTIVGVSKQDSSFAIADQTAQITIHLAPVADATSVVTAAAQGSNSVNATILEGGTPTLSLSASPNDAKELIRFEVLVGGSSDAADAIAGLAGATSIALTATKAVQFGLVSNEAAATAEILAGWKLYSVQGSASGDTGDDGKPVFEANALSIELDQFFDGQILYKSQAFAIEPTTGQEGVASTLGSSSTGAFSVTPTVTNDAYLLTVTDTSGTQINTIALDEGGISSRFLVTGTPFDSDESLAIALNVNTTYFTVESEDVEGQTQYWIGHKSDAGIPLAAADLTVTPDVTVTDGSATGTFSATGSALDIVVNKTVTKPVFSDTDLISATISDGASIVAIPLPARVPDAGDDTVLYRLKSVPSWLVPSTGTLVSTDIVNSVTTSTYQFTAGEASNLSWTAPRGYVSTDSTASMSWTAIHVEPSSLRTLESDPVTVSVTLKPVAAAPVVLGPSSFSIDEGQSVELSQYTTKVPGFSDVVMSQTVWVTVTLDNGATIEYTKADKSEVSATGTVSDLTLAELATARVMASDPNYFTSASRPNLTFRISAEQRIANSTAESTELTATIAIANVPESVSLVLNAPEVTVPQGGNFALDGVTIAGATEGESVSIFLRLAHGFTIGSTSGDFTEIETDDQQLLVKLDPAKLLSGSYSINAPSSLSPGSYEVVLLSQSVSDESGKAGLVSQTPITVRLAPAVQVNDGMRLEATVEQMATLREEFGLNALWLVAEPNDGDPALRPRAFLSQDAWIALDEFDTLLSGIEQIQLVVDGVSNDQAFRIAKDENVSTVVLADNAYADIDSDVWLKILREGADEVTQDAYMKLQGTILPGSPPPIRVTNVTGTNFQQVVSQAGNHLNVVAISIAASFIASSEVWAQVTSHYNEQSLPLIHNLDDSRVTLANPDLQNSISLLDTELIDLIEISEHQILNFTEERFDAFNQFVYPKLTDTSPQLLSLTVELPYARFEESYAVLQESAYHEVQLVLTDVSAHDATELLDKLQKGLDPGMIRVELDPQESIFFSKNLYDSLRSFNVLAHEKIEGNNDLPTFIDPNLGLVASSEPELIDTNFSADSSILWGPATGDNIFVAPSNIVGMGSAMFAGSGSDLMIGGLGHDYLFGDDGDDIFVPLGQADVIVGGSGADIVEISADAHFEEIERTEMVGLIARVLQANGLNPSESDVTKFINDFEAAAIKKSEVSDTAEVTHRFVGTWLDQKEQEQDTLNWENSEIVGDSNIRMAFTADFAQPEASGTLPAQVTFTSIMLINDVSSWTLDDLILDKSNP